MIVYFIEEISDNCVFLLMKFAQPAFHDPQNVIVPTPFCEYGLSIINWILLNVKIDIYPVILTYSGSKQVVLYQCHMHRDSCLQSMTCHQLHKSMAPLTVLKWNATANIKCLRVCHQMEIKCCKRLDGTWQSHWKRTGSYQSCVCLHFEAPFKINILAL